MEFSVCNRLLKPNPTNITKLKNKKLFRDQKNHFSNGIKYRNNRDKVVNIFAELKDKGSFFLVLIFAMPEVS
jgi:hypothetical protein